MESMRDKEDCCRKSEVSRDAAREEKKNKSIGKYLLVGLAIAILLFAVGQTVQIGNLQEKAVSGSFAAAAVSSGAAASVPRSSSVPAMVGGC